MHIEKNLCDSVLGTLLSIDGKNKDTDMTRIDLQNMKIRKELHLYKQGNRLMKPHASYTLTPANSKKFGEWLMNVKFPDGFASNLKKNVIVTNNSSKVVGLKSHDCHVLIQRLLPIGIRKFLKKDIVDTIFELSNFFKLICSRTLKVSDLEKAKKDIVVILCKLEAIFPPAFFDVMLHLLIHLPEEAIRGGPTYLRWMYSTERFLGTLKKYVRNRARPESSIAEAYIANETLTFCSMYFESIDTKFNRPDRNWVNEEDAGTDKISVFQNHFRSIGKMQVIALDNQTRKKLEYLILKNCPEFEEYHTAHRIEITRDSSTRNVEDIQAQEFGEWLKRKLNISKPNEASSQLNDQLTSLANGSIFGIKSYPGCVVNGVKFLTYARDIKRSTQNSGIYAQDSDNQQYYGVLEEIYEVAYAGENSVIIFKCKWFNTDPDSRNVREYKNRISVNTNATWFQNDPFILASQAEQVFYLDDLFNGAGWRVVEHFRHRNVWDLPATENDIEEDVEDINNERIQLSVDQLIEEMITYTQSDAPPNAVTSNVDSLIGTTDVTDDDFINDDVDMESCDEMEMSVEEEKDDDIDDDILHTATYTDDSD